MLRFVKSWDFKDLIIKLSMRTSQTIIITINQMKKFSLFVICVKKLKRLSTFSSKRAWNTDTLRLPALHVNRNLEKHKNKSAKISSVAKCSIFLDTIMLHTVQTILRTAIDVESLFLMTALSVEKKLSLPSTNGKI